MTGVRRHRFPRYLAIFSALLVWGVCAPLPRAQNSEPAAQVGWNEREYARMRRVESVAERTTRRLEEIGPRQFDPALYDITEAFEMGLEVAPDGETETEEEAAQDQGGSQFGRIRVVSDNLDYDEEHHMMYGRSRTTVYVDDYILEADVLEIDLRLYEAFGTGNVILRKGSDIIHSKWIRFNFNSQSGSAYQVDGDFSGMRFQSPEDEDQENPAFKKMNESMSLMSNATVTGCDFPHPHYFVRAREFIIYEQDRIFARSAVLYLGELPVAYMPAYTRSIQENSAWSFLFGYDSDLGGVGRMTYDYYFKEYLPNPEEPTETTRRSFKHTKLITDFYTARGLGLGLEDKYNLDYDRHSGEVILYGIDDRDREVNARDADDDTDRYRAAWMHRTDITQELQIMVNADWISDPDIHYDLFDFFYDDEIRRTPERRARAALTLVKEQWLARIMVDVKDRIARDRINDFSNPYDNDADFDADLDARGRANADVRFGEDIEGIPSERWGRVSQRQPQVTIASNWLKPTRAPLYYMFDVNLINNLDKGLNVLDTGDDAYVRGIDVYNSLLHAWRINDTSVWTNRFGFGAAYLDRQKNDYGYDQDEMVTLEDIEEYEERSRQIGENSTNPQAPPDGAIWVDDETFLVGEEEYSLRDYDSGFGYADYESKWSTRFTDALRGYARYYVRESGGRSLGEWYREIGNQYSRSDLYDFPIDTHELTGGLAYHLAKPDLQLLLNAGQNLRPSGDIAPNEAVNWVHLGGEYMSPEEVFAMQTGIDYQTIRQRHDSAQNSYDREILHLYSQFELFPKHERAWFVLRTGVTEDLNSDPGRGQANLYEDADDENDFNEQDTRFDVTPILGARLGEKWTGEIKFSYDGDYDEVDYVRLVLTRDLHDAVLGLAFSMRKRNTDRGEVGNVRQDREWDKYRARATLSFKMPKTDQVVGLSQIRTVQDERKMRMQEER